MKKKSYDKIQSAFMIEKKTLNKLDLEVIYLSIIKAVYGKTTANIILNSERLKAFPLRPGKDKGVHSLPSYSE